MRNKFLISLGIMGIIEKTGLRSQLQEMLLGSTVNAPTKESTQQKINFKSNLTDAYDSWNFERLNNDLWSANGNENDEAEHPFGHPLVKAVKANDINEVVRLLKSGVRVGNGGIVYAFKTLGNNDTDPKY